MIPAVIPAANHPPSQESLRDALGCAYCISGQFPGVLSPKSCLALTTGARQGQRQPCGADPSSHLLQL